MGMMLFEGSGKLSKGSGKLLTKEIPLLYVVETGNHRSGGHNKKYAIVRVAQLVDHRRFINHEWRF